jgi:peptide/nickel transport system substrate-binding protein
MPSQPSSAVTRRHFLRLASILGGSALLAACQQAATPAAKPTEAAKPAAAAAAATTAPAAAAKPTDAPKPADAAKPAGQPTTAPAAAPAAAGPKGGTLTYAEAGDFTNFNPWAVTAVNQSMYDQVFSRLLWKDGTGKENPDLAESWEMAKDGLSWSAKIKAGNKWHDGAEVVADDFVKMFNYTKDETLLKDAAIKKQAGSISAIKDVKATDKYTVTFSFPTPVPYITELIDYWYAIRIDDPSDPSFTKKPPVGTGPFKMAEWQPNQFARFPKNPDFYMKDKPSVDEINFKRLEKAETLIPKHQSGGVDAILVTSAADVASLKADPNITLVISENAGSVFDINVNCTKPPFDKKEVRQALSYSLNRQEMAQNAFFGVSKPISTPFYNPVSVAYREDLVNAQAFDLDKAAKLLEGAGVKGLQMQTIVTPRWPQMKLFMLMWQADLAKIGVKLQVTEVETAKFYDVDADPGMLGNDVQPWLNGRVGRDPAILWASQANFRGNERNTHGFRSADIEKLGADGAGEPDPAKRKAIYQKLNEMMVDEAYLIQVATDPRIWALRKGTTGLDVDMSGNVMLAGVTVSK